jgi:hypothetical protein
MSDAPSGNTNRFRSEEWNPVLVKAAKSMYARLRLGDDELPKWSKLDVDSRDHYLIAARDFFKAKEGKQ